MYGFISGPTVGCGAYVTGRNMVSASTLPEPPHVANSTVAPPLTCFPLENLCGTMTTVLDLSRRLASSALSCERKESFIK
jgi:hypothetical protein